MRFEKLRSPYFLLSRHFLVIIGVSGKIAEINSIAFLGSHEKTWKFALALVYNGNISFSYVNITKINLLPKSKNKLDI